MNLEKMLDAQKKLDERIVKEKGLEGQDLLDKKILALQVELGELANEWRGFKFWSEDQKPRTKSYPKDICTCKDCESYWCDKIHESKAEAQGIYVNPLLEEYVDCLHFILSIGLELKINSEDICIQDDLTGVTATETFSKMFSYVSTLETYLDVNLPATITNADIKEAYHDVFECFIGLGEMLGFTETQIEQAYFKKNKVNHERQDNGY